MQTATIQRRIETLSPRGSKRLGGARRLSYAVPATCSRTVGVEAERRAVCIERCMHGSEGGAGASSSEAFRAYPTRPAPGSGRGFSPE